MAIIGTLPYTISSGQLISASPVMGNYNYLAAQINLNAAPLASPSFTGTLSLTGAASITGTLGVTGASTLAALSATTGTFSSTLAVTGLATLTGGFVTGTAGSGTINNGLQVVDSAGAYQLYLRGPTQGGVPGGMTINSYNNPITAQVPLVIDSSNLTLSINNSNKVSLSSTLFSVSSTTTLTGNTGIGVAPDTNALKVNGTAVVNADSAGTYYEVGLRSVPENIVSGAYTAAVTDRGKVIAQTAAANVTVNINVFSVGDVFSIYNGTAGNISIVQGTSNLLMLAGTATTGTRTLAQKGVATILCVGGQNAFVVSGPGVS